MNVVQVVPIIIHIIQIQKVQRNIRLEQKVLLVMIINTFIKANATLHVKILLIQQILLKEEFVLMVVIQQRDIHIQKQLKMELLNAKKIVIMMNILLEKFVMIIVQIL
jgi:hypothetical protein